MQSLSVVYGVGDSEKKIWFMLVGYSMSTRNQLVSCRDGKRRTEGRERRDGER